MGVATSFTKTSQTIKRSYCSTKGCPARGFIDFPLVLQDVIDVEIDHQNYSIDFSDLDIKTACKTYKIHGKACVRFETEINGKIMFSCMIKSTNVNQYTELKEINCVIFKKNGRSFPFVMESQINDYH